jgi:hypothetical protein
MNFHDRKLRKMQIVCCLNQLGYSREWWVQNLARNWRKCLALKRFRADQHREELVKQWNYHVYLLIYACLMYMNILLMCCGKTNCIFHFLTMYFG